MFAMAFHHEFITKACDPIVADAGVPLLDDFRYLFEVYIIELKIASISLFWLYIKWEYCLAPTFTGLGEKRARTRILPFPARTLPILEIG